MEKKTIARGSRYAALVAALALSAGLTACANGKTEPSAAAPASSAIAPGAASTGAAPSQTVEASPSESPPEETRIAKATTETLIGSLPEKGIFLYGVDPEGVNLRVGDRVQHFDWLYMTPRGVLPNLRVFDYDADGQDELAVDLYIGSGTGVSVEELHVVELQGDGPFKDRTFAPDDYIAQVNESVSFKTRRAKSGELFADLKLGEKTVPISLKAYQDDEQRGKIQDRLAFGSIVSFDMDGERPQIRFGVGFFSEKFVTPEYIGYLIADLTYDADGNFAMSNYRYEANDPPA